MNVITKKRLERVYFYMHRAAIRMGLHVLPIHHYTPVPNILELERTKQVWARRSELPGITIDLEAQVANLKEICLPFLEEYGDNRAYKEAVARLGPRYGYIEAQALHAVIRHYKPRRIVEVGSGVSTFCMLAASNLNRNQTGETTSMTCIEPFPSRSLRELSEIELVARTVQTVPLDFFGQLENGDLLFIDSSHTVKPGSDVNYLILEVLPRLATGVIVHVHDIYFPYDYQRDVLRSFLHWSESTLLRAYLTHNKRAHIIFSLSLLHYDRREALFQVFPTYIPQPDIDGLLIAGYDPVRHPDQHFPSSTYIEIQ